MIKTDWNIHDLTMLVGRLCTAQFQLSKKAGPHKTKLGLYMIPPNLGDMERALGTIDECLSRLSAVRCSVKAQIKNIERAEQGLEKASQDQAAKTLDKEF